MTRLLLYAASASDPQRFAVAPTLASAAARSGCTFECYYDAPRLGVHFGGGQADVDAASGSTVAGGRHIEQLLWLGAHYEIAAVGHPGSLLWPTLRALGATCLAETVDPWEVVRVSLAWLGEALPDRLLVLDAAPQGRHGVVVAPYVFPAFFSGPPAIGIEANAGRDAIRDVSDAIGGSVSGMWLSADRALALVDVLHETTGEVSDRTYAEVTTELAQSSSGWSEGVLLGDPDLVAAQLPKAVRLRLVPLYGQPQVEVIRSAAPFFETASEPVYGRQYDDRDFVELARAGHGLQVLDPTPPFDAAVALAPAVRRHPPDAGGLDGEPSDDQLQAWAAEGRVLTTLLFWVGMVRELDCLPTLIDVVATTGLSAGAVVTVDTLTHGLRPPLSLVAERVEAGGVAGHLELLVGSTGWGVAAEADLPAGVLESMLRTARAEMTRLLPAHLVPRGWWPLLDTGLGAAPRQAPVGWRGGPVVYFTPRQMREVTERARTITPASPAPGAVPDERASPRRPAGVVVDAMGLRRFVEERRPFDHVRPGPIEARVVSAVRDAGFEYMWTKASFGEPVVASRDGSFVALPFTAGHWDGWSPFYTVSDSRTFRRAERRLLRSGRPGWLASTVDSPLWLLPGESLRHGSRILELASLAARGGESGQLVNVSPNVVARYSRLLAG